MDKANKNSGIIGQKIRSFLTGDLGVFLYKIFSDILLLLLISYSLLLISEGVMPGLIGAYLSFTRLTLLVFAVLGIVIYTGKLNDITFELSNKKTALVCGLVIFSILLIINSLLKFAWWEIGVIIIATMATMFYLYRNLIKQKA